LSNYTRTLADFVVASSYDDFDERTKSSSKKLTLDMLGCMLGAQTTTRGRIITNFAKGQGGRPEASIIGDGSRVSATGASYVNAELAVSLDADEILLRFSHFGNSVIGAALAVAERQNATGKEYLEALVLGFEVASRLGLASPRTTRVVGTPPDLTMDFQNAKDCDYSWNVFGTAAAAGKLLRLTGDQMTNAFGLAAFSAPLPTRKRFLRQPRITMTKYGQVGTVAQVGVTAALLASEGFEADPQILDGPSNFFDLAGANNYDLSRVLEGLGDDWFLPQTSFKFYPCCRIIHYALDLLYRITGRERIDFADIDKIDVRLHPAWVVPNSGNASMVSRVEKPHGIEDFQFHARYVLATAMTGMPPGPEWQFPDNIAHPRLEALAKKIEIVGEPRALQVMYEQAGDSFLPYARTAASMDIHVGARTFGDYIEYASGDPWSEETRATWQRLIGKFGAFSQYHLSPGAAEKVVAAVKDLDNSDTVAKMVELAVPDMGDWRSSLEEEQTVRQEVNVDV
jgi:2-methylcitrate dehydratase PrpD